MMVGMSKNWEYFPKPKPKKPENPINIEKMIGEQDGARAGKDFNSDEKRRKERERKGKDGRGENKNFQDE